MNSFQLNANAVALSFAINLENFVKRTLFSDFKLHTKLDWNPSRRSSRGGIYKEGPGINIAMAYTAINNVDSQNRAYILRFLEYSSYDKDPIIGGFYSLNYADKIKATVAHEVAHAIQYFDYKKNNYRDTPHGAVFKNYYKMLRKEFINPALPEQEKLRKQYTDYLATTNKKHIIYELPNGTVYSS